MMKKFWKFLADNALLKILALCFACLLYAILHDGNDATITLPHVPITFRVPDSLCTPDGQYDVSLQVKGAYKEIMKLRDRRIEGEIKLSPNLKTARHEISLDAADFKIPEVEVIRITPNYLEVPIQRRITRTFAIKPQFAGVPADGYRVGEISVFPDKVDVTGPEFLLDGVHCVKTAEISVNGENSDFGKDKVELVLPGKDLVLKPASVSVNVQIRKRLNRNRVFSNVPVYQLQKFESGTGKKSVEFSMPSPQSVDVEVTGPDRDVSLLTAESILLFVQPIPAGNEKSGEIALPVESRSLRDFPDVKIVRIVPGKVTVKYNRSEGFLWRR